MLVAFTGVDCSGKTTQIQKLTRLYNEKGTRIFPIALTNKPTVEQITKIALSKNSSPNSFPFEFSSDHFAMAYNVDFFNHYIKTISPLVNTSSNKLVLSDRFTTCYKAFAFAIDAKNDISHTFLNNLIPNPDIEICFDLDIEIVLHRLERRKKKRSLDETYQILSRLISFYRDFAKTSNRIILLDANQPIDKITQSLYEAIEGIRIDKN